jgi:hypothetical protein
VLSSCNTFRKKLLTEIVDSVILYPID